MTQGTIIAHPRLVQRKRNIRPILRNNTLRRGLVMLGMLMLVAFFASVITGTDPASVAPRVRLRPPSAAHWLGTDHLGRDVFSRLLYGSRVSLLVGLAVATLAVLIGGFLGLISGVVRWIDGLLMRAMDGVMAIPAIMFAIALISGLGANLVTVCLAISIPEVPRVARLVRSVVLTVREEPYVEAAISMGTRPYALMFRHILPNVVAPLIAQASYIASSAILIEAALSFLGIGLPDEVPSWGNMMANARLYFHVQPGLMLFPGACIALTVYVINKIGDGLRDSLDPRVARSVGGPK